MDDPKLTNAELMMLGLVAERPRHGYELEQTIVQRGLREWTDIGFSSIYFLLDKLSKKGLVLADKPSGAKARKTFHITPLGMRLLIERSLQALGGEGASAGDLMMGLAHWPFLRTDDAMRALDRRREKLAREIERLENVQGAQQPMPDFANALFDYSTHQMRSEAAWVEQFMGRMTQKDEQGDAQ